MEHKINDSNDLSSLKATVCSLYEINECDLDNKIASIMTIINDNEPFRTIACLVKSNFDLNNAIDLYFNNDFDHKSAIKQIYKNKINASLKSNESKMVQNKNINEMEMKTDINLVEMTNDEMCEMLYKYICKDETNKFKQCLKRIKLLKSKTAKFNFFKKQISLHYILNKKLCGEFKTPLIVQAVKKNNIEIVETLLCKENDYKVWFFVVVWAFLRLFEISFVCFFFFKLVFFPYKMIV